MVALRIPGRCPRLIRVTHKEQVLLATSDWTAEELPYPITDQQAILFARRKGIEITMEDWASQRHQFDPIAFLDAKGPAMS